MKRYLFSVFIALLFVSSAWSQERSISVPHSFSFGKDSLVKEFVFHVDSGHASVNLQINAILKCGSMNIMLYGSGGVLLETLALDATESKKFKQERTAVKTDVNGVLSRTSLRYSSEKFNPQMPNADKVSGQLNKTVYRPGTGPWVVKMLPQNAEAVVDVSFDFQ